MEEPETPATPQEKTSPSSTNEPTPRLPGPMSGAELHEAAKARLEAVRTQLEELKAEEAVLAQMVER